MKMSHLIHLPLIFSLVLATTHAATFVVKNNCPYIVWGAASPGGGQQMNPGATWTFNVPAGTKGGRVWARTGCASSGPNRLTCNTGDCGGVLQCTGYGRNPNTLAEYGLNGFNNLDFFDISNVAGFNVPMSFLPTSNGCSRGPSCSADITGQCPSALKTNGGCMDPCTVFNQPQYCCNNGAACNPTIYSQFFKNLCPQAYSYPKDDATSTFTCPGGTNYMVTFCP